MESQVTLGECNRHALAPAIHSRGLNLSRLRILTGIGREVLYFDIPGQSQSIGGDDWRRCLQIG